MRLLPQMSGGMVCMHARRVRGNVLHLHEFKRKRPTPTRSTAPPREPRFGGSPYENAQGASSVQASLRIPPRRSMQNALADSDRVIEREE